MPKTIRHALWFAIGLLAGILWCVVYGRLYTDYVFLPLLSSLAQCIRDVVSLEFLESPGYGTLHQTVVNGCYALFYTNKAIPIVSALLISLAVRRLASRHAALLAAMGFIVALCSINIWRATPGLTGMQQLHVVLGLATHESIIPIEFSMTVFQYIMLLAFVVAALNSVDRAGFAGSLRQHGVVWLALTFPTALAILEMVLFPRMSFIVFEVPATVLLLLFLRNRGLLGRSPTASVNGMAGPQKPQAVVTPESN